jgi:monofunctional biosynthetic peptidoglycan transglycosylase
MRRAGRVIVAAAATGFACLAYSWLTLPDVRPLQTGNPPTTAFMQLRAEEAAAQGRTVHPVRHWMAYSRISPLLKRAVLVSEDAAFWEHEGVDYAELRASIEANWTRGVTLRGASTITQQLAKNLYLSPSRNPYRKIVELMITRRLEAELNKARLLELYLNVIEWGDDIWGADAAAHAYFNRPASDLTAQQAALLAGALINPHVYSPAHPNARLLRRQQIILRRMGQTVPPEPAGLPVAVPGPGPAPLLGPTPIPALPPPGPADLAPPASD